MNDAVLTSTALYADKVICITEMEARLKKLPLKGEFAISINV